MSLINKELAQKIIAKLKAVQTKSGGAHEPYAILDFQGKTIALTSIRRGSNKELGHGHMPKDLHISPGKAKLLGQCPMSREAYIKSLQEQGHADPDPTPDQSQPPSV